LGLFFWQYFFYRWTQIVQGRGYVTALSPGQRSQSIESAIAGRIEKWYVKEGQIVRKGDTILYISEVTDKFFDPNLLSRAESQIKAKNYSLDSYVEKGKIFEYSD